MLKSKKTIRSLAIVLFVLGLVTPVYAFDTAVVDWAIGELCGHITGHLGGLLVTVAGFGAIVAAAMGSYRVFYGAIITAVGAFATSTILGLYFPEAAGVCNGGGGAAAGGNGAPRIAAPQNIDTPIQRAADPFDTVD